MATIAQIVNALSSSPAVQKLPVAELGLQLERQSRLDVMLAARDRAVAELGLGSSLLATSLAGEDRYGIQQQLEQISAGGAALRATLDSAIIPEGLFSSFSESVKAAMPKDLLAGIEASANLFGTIDHRTLIDSFRVSADTAAASLSAGRLFGQVDQAEWRKQIEAMLTPQVDWHEQLAGIYGLPGQSYEIVGRADASLWASQAPAVIARRPEPQPPPKRLPPPQSGNFDIQPAQPGQPADWQTLSYMLAEAIKAKRATPKDVIGLLVQVEGWQLEALLAEKKELEAFEQAWLKVKRSNTPEGFAKKHNISKATLYRRWGRLKELRLMLWAWPGGETG